MNEKYSDDDEEEMSLKKTFGHKYKKFLMTELLKLLLLEKFEEVPAKKTHYNPGRN